MLATAVVLLPVFAQIPDFAALHVFAWVWVAGDPAVSAMVMGLLAAGLLCAGWRVLGPSQRWAWSGSCVVGFLVVVQGARMQSFHGAAGPDWTYPVAVGNAFLWFVVPFLVWWRQPARLEPLVRTGLGIAGVVVAVFCMLQYLLVCRGGGLVNQVWAPAPIDVFGVYPDAVRLSGLANSPNLTAAVLVVCWPALLGRYPRNGGVRVWTATALGIFLTTTAMLLTYTRAAYLGLLVQVVVLGLLALRSRERIVRAWLGRGLVLALVPLLLVSLAFAPVARRFASLAVPTDQSVGHRLHLYQAITQLIMERPICGWGGGMFGVLYRGFDRIPGVEYGYGDAHSGVLLWLFELGVAGCFLVVAGVVGWRMRLLLSRVPVWIGVSLLGAIPLLLTDNPTLRLPALSVPLLMMLAVLAGLGRVLERRCPPPRRVITVFVAAVACWMLSALLPPPDPIRRLEGRLEQSARRMKGEVVVAVQDLASGGRWGISAEQPCPSILAGIAVVADAALTQPHSPLGLTGFRLAPGAPSELHLVATRGDLAALLLSEPSRAASAHLLRTISAEELRQACVSHFGHEGFHGAELRAACSDCTTLDIKPAREPEAIALSVLATTATITQVLSAYWSLTDSATTGGAVAAGALAHMIDEAGLARHLQAEARLQGLSVYTGTLREEVLLVRGDWRPWGLAVRYASDIPIAARTDSVANRMFADIAWKVACYLDTFSSAMSAAEPEATDRLAPWFLRRGILQWPAEGDGEKTAR